MIFADQQWPWKQADGPIQYGFVSNAVHICRVDSRAAVAFVLVPTEFFQLLPVAFADVALTHASLVGASFFLDEAASSWVMGVETADGKYFADLWSYSNARLPMWATLALGAKH